MGPRSSHRCSAFARSIRPSASSGFTPRSPSIEASAPSIHGSSGMPCSFRQLGQLTVASGIIVSLHLQVGPLQQSASARTLKSIAAVAVGGRVDQLLLADLL